MMRWRVGRFPDEVWIAPSFGASLPEGAIEISPEYASYCLDAWLSADGLGRQTLAEIYDSIAGPWLLGPQGFSTNVRAEVREALRRGALKAYRVREKHAGSRIERAPEAPKSPEPTQAEKKTFVHIELVDDADPPNPIAFKKYRIELPDHSVREGMLDANGQAKISGIDPGDCKVSFPGLHGADWGAS